MRVEVFEYFHEQSSYNFIIPRYKTRSNQFDLYDISIYDRVNFVIGWFTAYDECEYLSYANRPEIYIKLSP